MVTGFVDSTFFRRRASCSRSRASDGVTDRKYFRISARSASVRRDVVNALGQMRSRYDLTALLASEQDAAVRAAIYETLGRNPNSAATTAQVLTDGLRDSSAAVRSGAARGLESLLRRTARTAAPSANAPSAVMWMSRPAARNRRATCHSTPPCIDPMQSKRRGPAASSAARNQANSDACCSSLGV